jgi:hypothetical protein
MIGKMSKNLYTIVLRTVRHVSNEFDIELICQLPYILDVVDSEVIEKDL